MSGNFNLGDYKEVADRIPEFYERYPDGRIAAIGKPEVVAVGNKTFIGVTVGVWRTPDDPQPCIASAWEPFPGATTFTKDSEMMNAETSAWGRALVAAGILAKGEKIASRNEVRNRREENKGAGAVPPTPTSRAGSVAPPPAPPAKSPEQILDEAKAKFTRAGATGNGYDPSDAVCPSCGRKEALRPTGNPRFCAKAQGGCGFPSDKRGETFSLITYGEWLERHP